MIQMGGYLRMADISFVSRNWGHDNFVSGFDWLEASTEDGAHSAVVARDAAFHPADILPLIPCR